MRLRTKFLLSLLLVSASLTWATLLIVRYRVRLQVRDQIYENLRDSVVTFQNFEHQREVSLTRLAGLVANLPSLKALMTTEHQATIQDASTDYWRQIGSDLFVLANRAGRVMALDPVPAGITAEQAQQLLARSLAIGESRDWWFAGGHVYEVFLQPIYFGSPADNTLLGVVASGYEIDNRLAGLVSQAASSQVAFRYGQTIVVSTLSPAQQSELERQVEGRSAGGALGPEDIRLGGERFLLTTMTLAPGSATPINLSVLKSYDQATLFLANLNRVLMWVGLVAVLAGSGLVFLISTTFTRPLADLVSGVRALEKGDFGYPLKVQGDDEVSQLTAAFDRTRRTLQMTQQELLHSERLATIGLMASTISHDLRHPLTAILAYAEFLSEGKLSEEQRQDLYHEIRLAVNRMTDQISSLLGFSKEGEVVRPVYSSLDEVVERAIQTVRARPEFQRISISFTHDGADRDRTGARAQSPLQAWFDPAKLERVFLNLLINACEAVPPGSGKIEVSARQTPEGLEVRVADNGPGIPQPVRDSVFHPFVSYGKENGIGLGLTVARKIMLDHGGQISIETTGGEGTVFKLSLPDRPLVPAVEGG